MNILLKSRLLFRVMLLFLASGTSLTYLLLFLWSSWFCQHLMIFFLPILWRLPFVYEFVLWCNRSSLVQEDSWTLFNIFFPFQLAKQLTEQETSQYLPMKTILKKVQPRSCILWFSCWVNSEFIKILTLHLNTWMWPYGVSFGIFGLSFIYWNCGCGQIFYL